MDNNFWISAAIAAVVGGAWLFKKGKSAYSFFGKRMTKKAKNSRFELLF